MRELLEKLTSEIKTQGVISFARFMELALYCPVYGYYEKEGDTVGRKGDFYTSVSVGSLFGKMLAVQFAEWLGEKSKVQSPKSKVQSPKFTVHRPQSTVHSPESIPDQARSGRVQLVEAGAHKGELAKDILRWLRDFRPELFERLEYWIIEPSDRRQQWQKESLADFPTKVKWTKDLSYLAALPEEPRCKIPPRPGPFPEEREKRSTIPEFQSPTSDSNPGQAPHSTPIRRIIFCNELLDAMPVHRWGWDAKQKNWFEWGVTLERQQFVWTRMASPMRAQDQPARFGVPPSGGRTSQSEVNTQPPLTVHLPPELSNLSPVSCLLSPLMDLLPDGFTLETSPAALTWWNQAACLLGSGKLIAIDYGLTNDELIMPERRDGTLRAYRHHHLSTDILAEPGQQDLTAHVNFTTLQHCGESAGLKTEAFLTQSQFLTSIAARIWNGQLAFEQWTPAHTRQFQTLTSPEHFGRAFRVLIQARP